MRDRLADAGLADVAEPAASQQVAGALGDDDGVVGRQAAQRRDVQVVDVHVGDQHGVDRIRRGGGDGAVAPEVGDAAGEHGVGQQPDAAELDEDRGVADPRELQRRFGRHRRRAYGPVADAASIMYDCVAIR